MAAIGSSEVEVELGDGTVKARLLGLEVTVAHCQEGFDLRVRRAVEKTYSFVRGCGGSVPDVAICDVTDAVLEAVRSHPDFPAWDVHSA